MSLIKRTKKSIYGLENDLSTLASDIASESSRAQGAESTLTSNLSAEVTRATTAEAGLSSAISAETTRAQGAESTLQSNIDAEASRATTAEAGLSSAISSEATRAQAAEAQIASDLSAEVTRATAAEGTLTSNLSAEVTRATTAEAGLQSNIDAEAAARTSADNTLQGNIDTLEAKVVALGNAFNYVGGVDGGVDEASAYDLTSLPLGGKDAGDYYKVLTAGYFKVAEVQAPFYANVGDGIVFNTLGKVDKIDNTDSNVFETEGSDIAVTGSADTGFYLDIKAGFKGRVSTLESGLSSEISRATSAEAGLQSNIDAEASRAQGAEASLSSAISAEASRATTAEAGLQSNIDAEVTRATAAEATKLAIAANLSDVADVPTARTNLDVYSKSEVDSAISSQSNKTMNATVTVVNGKVTFPKAPVGGVDGVAFGIINVFGVVTSAPNVADMVEISIDASDASGKTFIVNSDVAGEYDGLTAKAFIVYNPSVA